MSNDPRTKADKSGHLSTVHTEGGADGHGQNPIGLSAVRTLYDWQESLEKSEMRTVQLTTGQPTCADEAEALKEAPPWRGKWAARPTIRQRFLSWWAYLIFKSSNPLATERK